MNFNKNETIKKQKHLVSKASKNKEKAKVSVFKGFLICIIAFVAICIGAGLGMFNGVLDDAPSIDDINVVPEGFQTCVYDQNGNLVTTLSSINSNREYVSYDEIPANLRNAYIAIEDARFWQHNGIDIRGIFRAAYEGVRNGFNFNQGASTITQQLIKNEVFNVGMNENTKLDSVKRKIQEQYLAIELEKRLSKEEILEYYLNSIYLGEGCHGVETATKTYFGKEMSELTVSECAVIAAITQNPSKYDPALHPDQNAKRRQTVLDYMLEQGYIDDAEFKTACADDVYSRVELTHDTNAENASANSYFIDSVINALMNQLINEYGYSKKDASNLVYAGGLSVYITQDAGIQNICDTVLNDPENYPASTQVSLSYQLSLMDDDQNVINFSTNHLLKHFKEKTGNNNYSLIYSSEEEARAAADEFKADMMAENPDYPYAVESYDTTIQPQISFTLMDQSTGYVKAIVGGRGDKKGDLTLNRATDSARQPGSCFKVLAAFVPALDAAGKTLATTYEDAPFTYDNGRPVANWWGDSYRGFNSIRDAIRDSMNVIAVKTITDIGPQLGFDYLMNMGFTTLVESETYADGTVYSDIQQSLALGGITNGVTNLEITAAYASIANTGVYVEPIFYTKVLDHDGNVLIDNQPETKQIMQPTTAWLINNAMKDVITSGTGGPCALSSGMPVSGKTGTSSKDYDLWFCGSTPYYTASIWLGYDINTSLPKGSGSLHERMWSKIMQQIVELEGQEVKDFPKVDGITSATVCKTTGLLPKDGCETRTEYFAVGTVPTETCGMEVIDMCAESNLPATENCPEKYALTFFRQEDGSIYIPYAFQSRGIPAGFDTQTCPIHPAGTTTEEATEADSYMITSKVNGTGGTITASCKVPKGGSKTFYITPATGYAIADVLVDGQSKGAVSSYTFKNVNENHSITVKFTATESTTTTEAPTSTDTAAPTESTTETSTDTSEPAPEVQTTRTQRQRYLWRIR